ncbi:MAG TPA: polysaccharide deacetylase family protein [Terriglobales bacterium]|nr:polysaccharide deacetylase family protein [Terriglobales bacterium]
MLPLITGAAALAAAGLAAYHSMSPRSQLYGETFIGTPGSGKQLALTYDDGPNDPDTLRLLDVLAKYKVKATFFLIGTYVQQRPDIVQRIIAEGHEIGNHTFTHPVLSLCDEDNLLRELLWCEGSIVAGRGDRTVAGTLNVQWLQPEPGWHDPNLGDFRQQLATIRAISGTKLFRPPFGARRPATLRIARQMGYIPVMWSVWCFDWKETTADRVEAHAVKNITGGDVILLHDGGHKQMGTDRSHTVEATERMIRRYQGEGFEFVTVSRMMAEPG